jgi:Protein of unknown function, DUF417
MKTSYTNKGALTAQESSCNPVGSIFNESMNLLIKILTKLSLLTKDLDYHVVRATMVIIYFFFGYQKWFPYEAQTLVPFISNGPLISWMYPVFCLQGSSWFLGVSEWLFGALIFLGFWNKKLVHQVSDWGSGAAAYFGRMREATRENTRCGLWPMSDKAAGQKTRSPEGCDENGPAPALLLSHVSIQICSFVAPCWRPILIATPLHQSLTWCTRHPRSRWFMCYLYHYDHHYSVYARRLECGGRRLPAMQGNVAFLLKDVVLFAVSFYLLKQDVERASWSTGSAKTA